MIGKAVPKRFRRNVRGMPTSSWFASSLKIAPLTSESSMVDSRISITRMSKASLTLFDNLRLSCSFE